MSGTAKKILAGIAVLVVAAFLVFKFYGASMVKSAVEKYGPDYTGTSVSVSDISFSPIAGNFGFSGLVVGNPEGYEGERAFTLTGMRVSFETMSLFDDVVKIREIRITDPVFEIELRGLKSNTQAILDNLSAYQSDEPSETRVAIDDFYLTGATVSVTGVPLETEDTTLKLPDIHIQDIGTGSANGATFAESSRVVMAAITAAVTRVIAENQARGLFEGIKDKVKGLFGGDDEEEDEEEE